MFLAAVVLNLFVAAVLTMSAASVARHEPASLELLARVRAVRLTPVIVAAAVAGAAGLVVGLFVAPLGVLAGVGVLAFMACALLAHLRVGDRNILPPMVIGGLAAAATVLRYLTA